MVGGLVNLGLFSYFHLLFFSLPCQLCEEERTTHPHLDSLFSPYLFGGVIVASGETQETMWQMNMRMEQMGPGPFPVREGQPDCSYYIQAGQCRYGAACRFNHPANRVLAIAASRMKGAYPQRIGQPDCQYYMKTGTCKFGATCKFHHPADELGVAQNVLGYPLRPNEIDCTYYMKNGECKYGSMCRFNHPHLPLHGSSIYPPVHSPNTAQVLFSLPTASYVPSPQQWENPSSYAPVVMPQGVQSGPAWNTYNVGLVSAPGNQQPTARNGPNDGMSPYNETANVGAQYNSGSAAFQREDVFPERPGQPECQYFMKTGDCKFGAVCKFDHPRERRAPVPDCVLSPKGLPLRPGAILCVFYSRYGICKFGPSCKFDHPMTVSVFNAATPSPNDSAAVNNFMASSSGTVALTLPQDGIVEDATTDNRRLSLPEAMQKKPHSDNKIDSE